MNVNNSFLPMRVTATWKCKWLQHNPRQTAETATAVKHVARSNAATYDKLVAQPTRNKWSRSKCIQPIRVDMYSFPPCEHQIIANIPCVACAWVSQLLQAARGHRRVVLGCKSRKTKHSHIAIVANAVHKTSTSASRQMRSRMLSCSPNYGTETSNQTVGTGTTDTQYMNKTK
jgi:hypothetical protein